MRFARFILPAVAVAAGCLAGEVLLGYLYWLQSHRESAIGHTFAALRRQIAPPPPAATRMRVGFEPRPLYAPDAYLGYASRPGSYTVEIRDALNGRRHRFPVTVNARGHRITAPPDSGFVGKPEVWVFGDSFVFGWGNRDETTFPYFLQRYLPDRRVVNFGGNGYGNVHAYLQFKRALSRGDRPPAVVVVAYADYFNERNVAAPSRIATFRMGAMAGEDAAVGDTLISRFTHPRARLKGGRLVVDYVRLFPGPSPGKSTEDPSLDQQYAVTRRLLSEILAMGRRRQIPVVLAYLRGPDDDPVVASARRHGYVIADLRPDRSRFEWDHFQPFDPHPGPLAQSVYAWKLFRVLSRVSDGEGARGGPAG